jgi:hypothetical protein
MLVHRKHKLLCNASFGVISTAMHWQQLQPEPSFAAVQ